MAPLAYLLHAPKDKDLVEAFLKHVRLAPLRTWHPGLVKPGEDRLALARAAAESADLLLVFVSSDLVHEDDPVWSVLERRIRKYELRPIPILVRDCGFENTRWGGLQALPRLGGPIKGWADKDKAWTKVVEQLIEALAAPGVPLPEPARRAAVQSIGVLLDRKKHWREFTEHCQSQRYTLTLLTGPPHHGLPFFVSRIRHHLPEEEDLLLVELRDEWEGLPAHSADAWTNALRWSLAARLRSAGTLVSLLQQATHHQGLLLLLWPRPLERHTLPAGRRQGLRALLTAALPQALREAAPNKPVRVILPLHHRDERDELLKWGRTCLDPAEPLSARRIPVEDMPKLEEVREFILERRPDLGAEEWQEIETYYKQEIASFAALAEHLEQYV